MTAEVLKQARVGNKSISIGRQKSNLVHESGLVALIGVRAQQAESAGKGFTWLPAFEQLTLALKEHHDESNYDRILPCSAAFAIRLGRTFKPSTTYGAEAFSTILTFVHKEL